MKRGLVETILLVEDEAGIADTVVYALQTEGFRVRWVRLGEEGLEAVRADPGIALVIMDVGLPDGSGFEFCKALRRFSDIPMIFLTARGEEVDRIVGLEIGGDDYVTKPFSPRELAARVKVVLRRSQSIGAAPAAEVFVVDAVRARIGYRGETLNLTRYEFLILKMLLSQPERVFSRDQIMEHVWHEPGTSLDRAVDTHIKSLRAKLRAVDPQHDPIVTHRGLGYSISGSVREA